MFRKLANIFFRPMAPRSVVADLAILKRESELYAVASDTFSSAELIRLHPPQIEHAKKKLLFEFTSSNAQSGSVSVSRYRELPIPTVYQPFDPCTEIVARKGYFHYGKTGGADDWFMNFAHHDLFNGYGYFMFAQDEIQVAEHPVLASFREMMLTRSDGLCPATVEAGEATPVLFRGAQRMAKIDTSSIYGARFARSEDATIRDAVSLIEPPSLSNILAMEAPVPSGNRICVRPEIEAALRTAYSGFRATILDSVTNAVAPNPIVLHTGNWGCGAYGGNRQLMLTIQMIAARLAGVSKLVFYCGVDSKEDVHKFDVELERRFKFRPGIAINKVIDRLVTAAFPWGTPDGN